MVRPEVVDYLRTHLGAFTEHELRRQLLEEGVAEVDFDDSLAVARGNPKPAATPTKAKSEPPDRRKAMMLAAALGSVVLLILGLTMLLAPAKTPSPEDAASTTPGSTGESAFIGHSGWVVRLPANYIAMRQFNDAAKTDEVVHFCPRGTDPTNFIDEEMFGQLGIVRVEVAPSDFPQNAAGVAQISRRIASKLSGDKYSTTPLQIGTFTGVKVNVLSPFPRVEAYLLGRNQLYFFYAGQEDEIWRAIVMSLRDSNSEN
jgi:hypothetical protein